MNEETTDLEIQVICSFKDAIKWHGIYVPLGEDICKEYQDAAIQMNIRLSHGLCETCYEREKRILAEERHKRNHEIFMQKCREYFRV